MSKAHLKRIALPRTWSVPRKSVAKKSRPFISKPNSGKNRNLCLSINTALKEMTGIAKTTKEVKAMLQFKHVFVNGTRVRDEKFPVGLFDVISFTEVDDCYRLILNKLGKLAVIKFDAKDKNLFLRKIEGKTLLKSGKLQLNLSNSSNLIVEKSPGTIGDVLVLNNKTVEKVLALKTGCQVVLTSGKHIGALANVIDVKDNVIFIEFDGNKFETLKKYAFVVGEKAPIVQVRQ